MNTAQINIKINPKVKKQAKKVAYSLGFSLNSLINAYLQDLVRNKTVHFSAKEEPSDYLIEAIKEAEVDNKKGQNYSFDKPEDALNFIDDIINEEK